MKNYFDLTGKVALITGASSGLGVQFAKALVNQGAKVALAARRMDKLEAVKAELTANGAECEIFACDVTDPEQVKAMVAAVCEKFGRIDILVNNAGIASANPTTAMGDEEWDRLIRTNLYGVFYVGREVGKVMVQQKYGKIINMGSLHSSITLPDMAGFLPHYCASKGGVKMLTKAWAVEWAKSNITVNAIGPAYFRSEMTSPYLDAGLEQLVSMRCPMGRIGAEGELDGALIYFASDASSYTTGQLLTIDGGWTAM